MLLSKREASLVEASRNQSSRSCTLEKNAELMQKLRELYLRNPEGVEARMAQAISRTGSKDGFDWGHAKNLIAQIMA
ncbi:MAG: hypothetical protein ACYDHY_18120 [Acidiferrobacterales bacterium]